MTKYNTNNQRLTIEILGNEDHGKMIVQVNGSDIVESTQTHLKNEWNTELFLPGIAKLNNEEALTDVFVLLTKAGLLAQDTPDKLTKAISKLNLKV